MAPDISPDQVPARPRRDRLGRWGPVVALSPVLLALLVQSLLWSIIEPYAWFLFFPAVFASSWLGGLKAGLRATALSTAVVWWFFIPPTGALVKDERQLFPAVIFVGMGVVLSLLQARLLRAEAEAAAALEHTRAANDELHRANEEATRLYQRTLDLDEFKSRLFANVSHELRTPLTLILGPSERLLATHPEPEVRRTLELIDRNARVLLRHVNDLLEVARLDAGKTELDYRAFDLAELMRLVTGHYEALVAERDIRLVVGADDPVPVEADAHQLHRVVMNLLSNAVKFTPAGGVVRAQVAVDADGEHALIEIADSGPGIPQGQREAIFERFVQGRSHSTGGFGGTGLGLSIIREFAILHGGTVTVADAPEGGALFQVRLPLCAPAGMTVAPQPPDLLQIAATADAAAERPVRRPAGAEGTAGRPGRPLVLVVEDDADLSAFMADVLAEDYRVAVAFDGLEGLEEVRRLRPDLVVCDVMMPRAGGEDFLLAVRADPELRTTPVLMLTAKADDDLRIRLLRAGAADYVMKPFSVAELRARVDNLVALALSGEQLRASEAAARELAITRQHAENDMRALLESAPDAMVVVDEDGIIRLVNHRTEELFGYGRDELVGQLVEVLLPEPARGRHVGLRGGFFAAMHARAMGAGLNLSGRRKDGTEVPIDVSLSPFQSAEGVLVTAAIRDITERRALEERLRLHGERFRATFHDAPIGMAISDLRSDRPSAWVDVNEALCRTLGFTRQELLEVDPEQLVHPEDRAEPRLAMLTTGLLEHHTTERRYRHSDGRHLWVRLSVSIIRGPDGQPEVAISHMEDITARREAAEQLAHAALHDPLTGLPNRTLLVDRLAHQLSGLDRSGRLLALLYIDLDRFKHVNDSLGHAAGDEMLMEIARRLQTFVRPTDTAARLAGDEFVLVCHDLHDERDALMLAERVVRGLDDPVVIEGQSVEVGASVGMAITRQATHLPEALLREADAAMYRAKRRGGRRVELFDDSLAELVAQDAEIEDALRDALDTDRLRLHYQPIVDIESGTITGVEALLRLEHRTRGLLRPESFLDVAEASGLIVPIGNWVIREACRQLVEWDDGTPGTLTVAVNVSQRQFARGDLSDVVTQALADNRLDGRRLTLEITETIFADASLPVVETLRALKVAGVHLSLDDFGTGYSSLAYLKRFSVDQLKIDRGFTAGIDAHRNDTAIIDAITSLGRSLGLDVVAEGVETLAQLQSLRRLGCRLAQGHLFAAAGEPEAIGRLLGETMVFPSVPLG